MLKNTNHEIIIKGLNLDPLAIKAVWVDRIRVSYEQVSHREIKIASPYMAILADTAVNVSLETLVPGQFTNSLQIIYTSSLNLSQLDRTVLV
jgi:hypothetical protein